MKYCQKLGETRKNRLRKVYGEGGMMSRQAYECLKRFNDGCERLESIERTEKPLTSKTYNNIELVRVSVH